MRPINKIWTTETANSDDGSSKRTENVRGTSSGRCGEQVPTARRGRRAYTMDAVADQLDDMSSHMRGMARSQQQGEAARSTRARKTAAAKKARRSKRKTKAQKEKEAEEEAAVLLARARRLVDAAKEIELPDFSTLFQNK